MRALFRRVLPTWAKTLNEEIAKIVVTAVIGVVGVWCAYLLPAARTWLAAAVTTSIGAIIFISLLSLIAGAGVTILVLKGRINALAALAATDELTQIFNHREFKRRLDEEVSRSKRQKCAFCFILIDIDSLKLANDTHGYSAGDNLLREFAQLAKSNVRLPDVLARYRQGDEFAILALDTNAAGARVVAERLRGQIQGYHFFASKSGATFTITFSAGIAEFDHKSDSADTLQKHAEIALATAKKTKNVVAAYAGTEAAPAAPRADV